MESLLPSVLAGICAALAGASGKGAFKPWTGEAWNTSESLWKGVFFVLMFVFNALMMKFFVESLKTLGPGKSTVANFTCNYLTSAFIGYLIYGETVSVQWTFGAALMAAGVFVLSAQKTKVT